MSLAIGQDAPDFTLPDVHGRPTPLTDAQASATVVAFTCNHCPYALAWHARLNAVAEDYSSRGVRFLQISSNDAERYPADSLEQMRARVDRGEFSTPYLYDESQDVARAWGATVTPDVFLLDSQRRVVYHGAPDSDYNDESLTASWLRDALDDVLAGREVSRPQTEPRGCSMKWRA